jgi:competence ComEA-like helix-hairpin-helix protein
MQLMAKVSSFFDFSASQLRFLVALTGLAVVLAAALLIRTYATPTRQAATLPVILGEPEIQLTGLFLLDPNTAPADSLELLPGIGKTLADRIVAYRQEHRYETEIDITNVTGIGPKLYERLKPYLRVNRP